LEMGQRGRAFVSRHYSPRVLAKRLKDVYSHILGANHLEGKLSVHLAQTEARHKSQVERLTGHLAKTEARHRGEVEEFNAILAQAEERHRAEMDELKTHLTKTDNEIEQLRQRVMEMNILLHQRSVNLAEDEKYIGQLTERLRKQLQNTRRLSRLLQE